ncbi:hypothetical protein BGZ73_008191 [Actinomortierella ambigua]|nr:hypothetical protein BGZ73_008191 [Actinomortierella ambigua]
MPKVHDEEHSSYTTALGASSSADVGIDGKEKELLDREARSNETIDAKLRDNLDRDPRIVWLAYAFQLLHGLAISAVSITQSVVLLQYDRDDRYIMTDYYWAYRVLKGLLPFVGAVMADSYIGKWLTLIPASIIFLVGTLFVAVFVALGTEVAKAAPIWMVPFVLLALGYSSSRPVIEALAGDQFLAIQERGLARTFAMLYFASRFGEMLGENIYIGLLKRDVKGEEDPTALHLMIITSSMALLAVVVMAVGFRRFRTVLPVGELVPLKMAKTAIVAASRSSSASAAERTEAGHWLNFAAKDQGSLFVQEVYDFGLAMMPLLLPVFCVSMLTNHIEFYGDSWAHFSEGSGMMAVEYIAWYSHVQVYGVLAVILVLTFAVFPLMERRGWNVSPHRRFGAGYVCALLSFAVSLIVHKAVMDTYESEMASKPAPSVPDDYESSLDALKCANCLSHWVTFPHQFLLVLHFALVMPAAVQIAYVETGRHLRTLAVAMLFVFQYLGHLAVYNPSNWKNDTYPVFRQGLDGGIGAAGFVLFLIAMRFYTPRKQRGSINDAARLAKDAEFAKQ